MPVAGDLNRFTGATVWTGETGTTASVVAPKGKLTIQTHGTGTVTVFGSGDGVNFVALNTEVSALAGSLAAISLAAASNALAVIHEHPLYIRCVVTGGTATIILTSE